MIVLLLFQYNSDSNKNAAAGADVGALAAGAAVRAPAACIYYGVLGGRFAPP